MLAFIEQNRAHAQASTRAGSAPTRSTNASRAAGTDLAELASDETDYKALIAEGRDTAEKVALAQKLATRRLACGVVPELDDCFAALDLR